MAHEHVALMCEDPDAGAAKSRCCPLEPLQVGSVVAKCWACFVPQPLLTGCLSLSAPPFLVLKMRLRLLVD